MHSHPGFNFTSFPFSALSPSTALLLLCINQNSSIERPQKEKSKLLTHISYKTIATMQGVRCLPFPPNPDRDFLTIQTNSNPVPTRQRGPRSLTIDAGEETPERRIERLIREHPVVIFARHGCCMSHVMKQLLAAVGFHPSVIEVEESEIGGIEGLTVFSMPALFVGGSPIGGIEGLMGLHLSGHLVPRLRELGVI